MKRIYDHERINDKRDGFSIVGATEIGKMSQNMDHMVYEVHPNFPNVKLLVLADGDSNAKEGAAGAQLFCDNILNCFKKLKSTDFENIEVTMQRMIYSVDRYITEFNKKCNKQCIAVGSVSIIMDDTLYNVSIGDISVYYTQEGITKRLDTIRTDYDIFKICGLSDEKIRMLYPDSKITPYKKIGVGEIIGFEPIYTMEDVENVFVMSDGVSRHVSKGCKKEIFESVDYSSVPSTLVEVAQYGYSKTFPKIVDEGDVSRSLDNLSVIGYVKEKQINKLLVY